MIDQTNDIPRDFDAKKFFTKARRIYIEEPLKTLGFKRYKSSTVARLTSGNIFQFLNFQKSAYGGQTFTINVAIRPLFSQNHEYLTLAPGNRLGSMDRMPNSGWWHYRTEAEGNESFKDVFDKIEKFALPFFSATANSNDIIASYERIWGVDKFGISVGWGTIGWEEFDFGHIYLHAGQIERAIEYFDACYRVFSKDSRDWAQAGAKKCLEIKQIVESGQPEIDRYLMDTTNDSKQKLKLVSW